MTIAPSPSFKEFVFRVIEKAPDGFHPAKYFNYFMVFLILLNVTIVVLETVRPVHARYLVEFEIIDIISVAIFTVEYVLRLWVSTLHEEYRNPVTGRLRFAVEPHMIIDALAVLPFYLPFLIPMDLRFLRLLRLFRIIRILMLGRYSTAVNTFHHILVRKKEELLLAASLLFIAIVLSSSLMYYAEHEAQPETFSSIPDSMWWAVITLATVGYGDIHPITAMGKLLSGIVVLVGIAIFALPTAIFASGFIEEIRRKHEIYCPYCGKKIDPDALEETNNHENNKDKPGE
ncbi:MAG: potassium channel family protein [Methanoregula sp.]